MRTVLAAVFLALVGSAAGAQETILASISTAGLQGNKDIDSHTMSADGRWVAFASYATTLFPGTTNPGQVFVKDLATGVLEIGSRSGLGAKGNGPSGEPFLSADGRFLAFESTATNLVPGDFNTLQDVFLRDLVLGTTIRVNLKLDGSESDAPANRPSVSDDGRFVSFFTEGTLGFAGDTNDTYDVFVRDTWLGVTRLVSMTPAGTSGASMSQSSMVSGDGHYVAFQSRAKDILPGQAFNQEQIYRRDLLTDTTERVSVDPSGAVGNSDSEAPAISVDGRYVAFRSRATNLLAGDQTALFDVYVRDVTAGTTERISQTPLGTEPNGESTLMDGERTISRDGRFVVYNSIASDILPELATAEGRVFVHDRATGVTAWRSAPWKGTSPDYACYEAVVSDDGQRVAFKSAATNMAPIDFNEDNDIFVDAADLVPWTDLGQSLAGSLGPPLLSAAGPLLPATSGAITLQNAPPSTPCQLVIALASQPMPFKGGTLVAAPVASAWPLFAYGAGEAQWLFMWPPGFPSGLPFYLQALAPDAGAPHGISLSNALQGVQP